MRQLYSFPPFFFLIPFFKVEGRRRAGEEGNKLLGLWGSRRSPSRTFFFRFKVERLNYDFALEAIDNENGD